MICIKCSIHTVPAARQEAGYDTCMTCAQKVQRPKGVTIHSHKTGSYVQVLSAEYYNDNKRFFVSRPGARSLMARFK